MERLIRGSLRTAWIGIVIAVLPAGYGKQDDLSAQTAKQDAGVPAPSAAETKAIIEEVFIYGFPLSFRGYPGRAMCVSSPIRGLGSRSTSTVPRR